MPGSETTDKVLGSAGLARLIGRIKAYVIPDGTTIERKQDGTLGLKSGGIQSEFLSNGCVTTDKIASSAVTSDKLADGSVETSAIADGAVTDAKFTGALSIVKGGTGATSASVALISLGAAAVDHVHTIATASAAGFMSADDKAKLDSIKANIASLFVSISQMEIIIERNIVGDCVDFSRSGVSMSGFQLSEANDYISPNEAGTYDVVLVVTESDTVEGNTVELLVKSSSGSTIYSNELEFTDSNKTAVISTRLSLSSTDKLGVFIRKDTHNDSYTVKYTVNMEIRCVE